MKKLLLAGLMLLGSGAVQTTVSQGTNFGIKTGVSVNNYTSGFTQQSNSANYTYTSDLKVGYAGGIYFRTPFYKHLSVQTELMLDRKGGRVNFPHMPIFFSENEVSTSEEVSLIYLNVPVLLQYDLSSESQAIPFLVSGVFAGYYLTGNKKSLITEYHNDEVVHQNREVVFFSRDVKSLNYGLIFGGGIKLSRFVIDVRYEYGLADITKTSSNSENGRIINRNHLNGFSVQAGIGF